MSLTETVTPIFVLNLIPLVQQLLQNLIPMQFIGTMSPKVVMLLRYYKRLVTFSISLHLVLTELLYQQTQILQLQRNSAKQVVRF